MSKDLETPVGTSRRRKGGFSRSWPANKTDHTCQSWKACISCPCIQALNSAVADIGQWSSFEGCFLFAGSTATSRLADLLQKLSPPAAADMLASMLTQSVPFKQQVLAAVDYNTRMRLALKLVQQVCLLRLYCCMHASMFAACIFVDSKSA